MEFVLGVVALCLAIMSVPWLKKPIEKAYRRLCTKWTVMMISKGATGRLGISVAIQKGTYQKVQHDFMICDWDHEVRVDKYGNSKTSVTAVLVNILNESVSGIAFPMYFSGGNQPPECWAKIGSQTCGSNVSEWDERLGCGYVWIDFPEAIQPRDDIRLNYGYGYPKVYENGSNWWEWFIERPHAIFRVRFVFNESL